MKYDIELSIKKVKSVAEIFVEDLMKFKDSPNFEEELLRSFQTCFLQAYIYGKREVLDERNIFY